MLLAISNVGAVDPVSCMLQTDLPGSDGSEVRISNETAHGNIYDVWLAIDDGSAGGVKVQRYPPKCIGYWAHFDLSSLYLVTVKIMTAPLVEVLCPMFVMEQDFR